MEPRAALTRPAARILWIARGVCLLALAGTLLGLLAWCRLKGWSHDEVENIHAGWLVYKGQVPYADFFHHKPPFYWFFISLYYRLAGENLAVMLWARHWMLATFVLAALFTFLVARELFDEWAGWAAAGILVCNALIHYPAIEPREQGWMLAFLMMGLYVYLRAWRRAFRPRDGLLAGLLLGAAYALHPRAGYPILALALGTGFRCQFQTGWRVVGERKAALALLALAFLGVAAIPYILYGKEFHHLLYRVSLAVAPEDRFPPWGLLKNLYFSTYAIMPFALLGLAACAADLAKKGERQWAAFCALVFFTLANLQIISNPRAFVQAFYSAGPFVALLCAAAVHWIGRRLTAAQTALGVACLVTGGFLSNVNPSYWTAPDEYAQAERRARYLLEMIPPGERYLGMDAHPIFRLDGSRYWFDMNHVLRSLQLLDPTFRHDVVQELEQTRPYLLGEDVFGKADFDPVQKPRLETYVSERYQRLPNAPFFIRKDALSPDRAP
ncbi:MAG TPA: glycosyltransferase family 39 protein [Kiritimatiellia bacterium]|nr:glycosyltransferase family 39 protein [Kiritimatiellia bacterium]HRZ13782.1 glycosyltransferase family 39 protein [Kiritimatiellia bacterium]HSA19403.1 glycosyltransferase family 39 protein [Kiritimatiellia bacterium]